MITSIEMQLKRLHILIMFPEMPAQVIGVEKKLVLGLIVPLISHDLFDVSPYGQSRAVSGTVCQLPNCEDVVRQLASTQAKVAL